MATSATAPSTPEPKVKTSGARSFTMPPALASMANAISPTSVETADAQGIETLFVHPSCTIVKFSTSIGSSSASAKTRGLQWSSPTERTVAAGSLEIYRVPGSVSFLHSGELLHAIMPRSQCWCVDGLSKFALRVLPDTYYRIELPADSQDELDAIEDLKTVLGKVMHYERTACPFARNTNEEEELPELEDSRNKTFSRSDKAKQWKLDRTFGWKGDSGNIVQLRPIAAGRDWRKPPASLRISEPPTVSSSVDTTGIDTPAAASATPTNPRTVISPLETSKTPNSVERSSEDSIRVAFELTTAQDTIPESVDHACVNSESCVDVHGPEPFSSSPPEFESKLWNVMTPTVEENEPAAERSTPLLTSGQKQLLPSMVESLTLNESQAPLAHTHEILTSVISDSPEAGQAEEHILLEDFRPLQQIPTYMPPSPPDSSAGSTAGPLLTVQCKDLESQTNTRDSGRMSDGPSVILSDITEHQSCNVRRPSRGSSSDDPFAAIQARILARRSIGGTTSFYPSVTRESTSTSTTSVNSSISSRSRMPVGQQRNLASALVQKACTVFLGPPAYLVAMMLRIAARFANGKFGALYNTDGSGEDDAVPGTYRVRSSSSSASGESEDDFGVAFDSPIRAAAIKDLRERRAKQPQEVD